MKIQPLAHTGLAEAAAGKLAASILEGSLPPGTRLPAERELMQQFGISRATMREALTVLEKYELIEARPHVGWFARPVNESNMLMAREMARLGGQPTASDGGRAKTIPLRVPIAAEKPVHIPNLHKDRLGTFDFISWWEKEKVRDARVMVVGAGALGNEVIKNLALMGVGHIFIVDFDRVEAANLSRSVLFRESDNNRGRPKPQPHVPRRSIHRFRSSTSTPMSPPALVSA
jgi:DNA-binding transcriptional regulator YhcF (GntR family)